GVLRLFRLAFVRARPLAAGAAGKDIPRRTVRGNGSRGAGAEPHRIPPPAGSGLHGPPAARRFRATLRPGLAASAGGRTRRMGRSAGAAVARAPAAAGGDRRPTPVGLAAQTAL